MKDSKKKEVAEVAEQVETVSPATRLLEKRRMMYENQEAYKLKKKEFQQEEAKFKAEEQDLQKKDQAIQESLIEFSSYLDANQKQMKRSDENIAKLTKENIEKDLEIIRKERILNILKQKAKRIEKQRYAVQKYEHFLEEVRVKNSDQYASITSIINRHKSLKELQQKLDEELRRKDLELLNKRQELVQYQSHMNTQTMQLNNTIANLKRQSEMIDEEKNKLKSQEQELSSSQLEKITKLSRILMAVDHLEGFCKYKTLQFDRSVVISATGNLNYDAINMQEYDERKKQFQQIHENLFDSYNDRKEYALSQLYIIGQYLSDFKEIRDFATQQSAIKNKDGTKAKPGKEVAITGQEAQPVTSQEE